MSAVDVLAVMRAAEALLSTQTCGEAIFAEQVEEARAAVAELIEAANAAMHATTEADQNAADARLLTALANCGGAK